MDSAKEAALLRTLIADNRNKEVAERLSQWFEGKSPERQDAALALLNRINALDDKVLGNLISQSDAELESNRITKALLELSKQLDRTDRLPSETRGLSPGLPVGIAIFLLLFGGALIWKFANKDKVSDEIHKAFSVSVYLYEQGNQPNRIGPGKVRLVIGDWQDDQDINSSDQAFFDQIPGENFNKPLRLIPVNIPYVVVSQTDSTAAKSQSITFALAPKPDTVMVFGIIYLPGSKKPAVGAALDFDIGKAKGVTDEDGYFKIPVPIFTEKTIKLTIRYKGEERYNRNVTIGDKALELTFPQ